MNFGMNFWRFCKFWREFLLKIHKAWLVFRLKIAFDKLGRPLRFQSSLRLPKTIFRSKYCALNFLTENSGFRLNFRFFSGVFCEFLHKFCPKFVIASLDEVKAWRLGRSGFCVAKMCCEPLGEAKSATHAVRSLVGQTLKAPSLAEGVGGGYYRTPKNLFYCTPQTPRHRTPQNVSVSQNLPPNSLKIQLPQFLECVK